MDLTSPSPSGDTPRIFLQPSIGVCTQCGRRECRSMKEMKRAKETSKTQIHCTKKRTEIDVCLIQEQMSDSVFRSCP